MEYLIDDGADPNARESAAGQTPLMFAAAYNRVAALQVLLGRVADVTLTTHVIDIRDRQLADRSAGQSLPDRNYVITNHLEWKNLHHFQD